MQGELALFCTGTTVIAPAGKYETLKRTVIIAKMDQQGKRNRFKLNAHLLNLGKAREI